jgi:2',3'-cyclic-nucleotide 2'-phosphodiesterase (5'-nucleotidase family)
MEGPLPVCEKLFKNKKLCDLTVLTEEEEKNYGKLLNFTFHNQIIEKEENIDKIGQKYKPLYNEYEKDYLSFTNEHLESNDYENALGNFYTDFLRHISGAQISVVNPGAFRTPFYRGNITNATIHSFDPFGNDIVYFYAYGWELKKIFSVLQKGSKGYYPSSGLKMIVKSKPTKKLISIKLYDGFTEKEIDDNRLYSIISSDFCFPLEDDEVGGDDFESVYKFFRPRNARYVNVLNYDNSRDLLIDYLRKISELKGNKYYNIEDQRLRIIETN